MLCPKDPQTVSDDVVVDGLRTVPADLIQFELKAVDFDRRRSPDAVFCDPHRDLLFTLLNSYLARIRTVCRAPLIRFLDARAVPWKLEYYDDAGTALPSTDTLVTRRVSWGQRIAVSAIPSGAWQRIGGLPVLFFPARHDVLLLDAFAALPDVGAALVLSFTAL